MLLLPELIAEVLRRRKLWKHTRRPLLRLLLVVVKVGGAVAGPPRPPISGEENLLPLSLGNLMG